jgi:hypothetical protein
MEAALLDSNVFLSEYHPSLSTAGVLLSLIPSAKL